MQDWMPVESTRGRIRFLENCFHYFNVWCAKVTLIDVYNTSQYCCQCHHALLKLKVTHSLDKIENSKSLTMKLERRHFRRISDEMYSEKPHGLRYCSFCWNESASPKFHHRDLNSAQNIMDIYLSLAQTGNRPDVFMR